MSQNNLRAKTQKEPIYFKEVKMKQIQNLGIDVAAKDFQVCLMIADESQGLKIKGSRKFSNTAQGFADLRTWLDKKCKPQSTLHVTMEATGVYYENLAYTLDEYGYHVHVLLPNRIKGYLKFLNLKSKTDKLEAKAMAQLGLEHSLPRWKAASKQMYSLKRLSRERNILIDEKTMISNRLHAEEACRMPDKGAIKRLKKRIDLLIKQIEEVETQMTQLVSADKLLAQKVENIAKVKGLGFITIVAIIAETNGFGLIRNKSQLVSYAGYDVVERQSGSSILGKTRISKKGNRHIRRALHFPAISAVKYQQEFSMLHQRVVERTKIKMKGYVAVQRKLLVLIYTLYKNNQPYDPQFQQKLQAQKL